MPAPVEKVQVITQRSLKRSRDQRMRRVQIFDLTQNVAVNWLIARVMVSQMDWPVTRAWPRRWSESSASNIGKSSCRLDILDPLPDPWIRHWSHPLNNVVAVTTITLDLLPPQPLRIFCSSRHMKYRGVGFSSLYYLSTLSLGIWKKELGLLSLSALINATWYTDLLI